MSVNITGFNTSTSSPTSQPNNNHHHNHHRKPGSTIYHFLRENILELLISPVTLALTVFIVRQPTSLLFDIESVSSPYISLFFMILLKIFFLALPIVMFAEYIRRSTYSLFLLFRRRVLHTKVRLKQLKSKSQKPVKSSIKKSRQYEDTEDEGEEKGGPSSRRGGGGDGGGREGSSPSSDRGNGPSGSFYNSDQNNNGSGIIHVYARTASFSSSGIPPLDSSTSSTSPSANLSELQSLLNIVNNFPFISKLVESPLKLTPFINRSNIMELPHISANSSSSNVNQQSSSSSSSSFSTSSHQTNVEKSTSSCSSGSKISDKRLPLTTSQIQNHNHQIGHEEFNKSFLSDVTNLSSLDENSFASYSSSTTTIASVVSKSTIFSSFSKSQKCVGSSFPSPIRRQPFGLAKLKAM